MSADLILGFLGGASITFAVCFGAVMYLAYKFADMATKRKAVMRNETT